MLIENVAIDRVNLRIEKVTFKEFEELELQLRLLKRENKTKFLEYEDTKNNIKNLYAFKDEEDGLFSIRLSEKLSLSEYRYQLNLSEHGTTDGAIFIGYKHNSAKASEYYDMKIEFNPKKSNQVQRYLLQALNSVVGDKVVKLAKCDVAIDIPYKTDDVYIVNKTGKKPSSCDTTRYFGESGTHGYLKLYDKLKEQKVNVSAKGSEQLTRVEFTLKFDDGIPFAKLLKYKTDFDKMYTIGLLHDIEDVATKCIARCLTRGEVKRSELPRYAKDTITKALSKTTNKMKINKIINSSWKELMESISEWFMWSASYSDNQILFGTLEERVITDELETTFEELIDESPDRSVEVSPEGQRIKEINKLLMDLESEKLKLKESFRHKKNLTELAVQ